jgi:homospermidine synthase
MAARHDRHRSRRFAVTVAVLAGAAATARILRDRAVEANTLRYDHVLDFSKPYLGETNPGDQAGSSTPSSASR